MAQILSLPRPDSSGRMIQVKLVRSVTAWVLWAEAKGKVRKEKRRFGTFTQDLLKLADWLREWAFTGNP